MAVYKLYDRTVQNITGGMLNQLWCDQHPVFRPAM
jgi:hypothetical protein